VSYLVAHKKKNGFADRGTQRDVNIAFLIENRILIGLHNHLD
jgi:hypothetical protein